VSTNDGRYGRGGTFRHSAAVTSISGSSLINHLARCQWYDESELIRARVWTHISYYRSSVVIAPSRAQLVGQPRIQAGSCSPHFAFGSNPSILNASSSDQLHSQSQSPHKSNKLQAKQKRAAGAPLSCLPYRHQQTLPFGSSSSPPDPAGPTLQTHPLEGPRTASTAPDSQREPSHRPPLFSLRCIALHDSRTGFTRIFSTVSLPQRQHPDQSKSCSRSLRHERLLDVVAHLAHSRQDSIRCLERL
jgi:hypothetical protein